MTEHHMSTTKTRTITLTDHAPVTIREDEWPEIARGSWYHGCGQGSQNGEHRAAVRVRQHADGRALVYVTSSGGCQCDLPYPRGGRLLAAGTDLPSAIRAVVRSEFKGLAGLREEDEEDPQRIAANCIADLPAEEI